MPALDWYRERGPVFPSAHRRVHVWRQDLGVYRVLAVDEKGDTDVVDVHGLNLVARDEALLVANFSPTLADYRDPCPAP